MNCARPTGCCVAFPCETGYRLGIDRAPTAQPVSRSAIGRMPKIDGNAWQSRNGQVYVDRDNVPCCCEGSISEAMIAAGTISSADRYVRELLRDVQVSTDSYLRRGLFAMSCKSRSRLGRSLIYRLLLHIRLLIAVAGEREDGKGKVSCRSVARCECKRVAGCSLARILIAGEDGCVLYFCLCSPATGKLK